MLISIAERDERGAPRDRSQNHRDTAFDLVAKETVNNENGNQQTNSRKEQIGKTGNRQRFDPVLQVVHQRFQSHRGHTRNESDQRGNDHHELWSCDFFPEKLKQILIQFLESLHSL